MRVELRWVEVSRADAELARAPSVLDPGELTRAGRLPSPAAADASRVARVLLRSAYGAALGVDPVAVRFAAGPYGRPTVAGSEPFSANVSHGAGLVAIASCRGAAVGVDVEAVAPAADLRVSARFFTAAEHAALAAAAPAQAGLRFAVLWTVKEAVLKATGTGLSGGLDTVEVPAPPLPRTSDPAAVDVVARDRWAVRVLRPDGVHVLAVAVAR